jgi:hypothetical protein
MNIIEQEDIIKGLPDDALQREARMPSGQVPQFLVVSEIQRRTDMRKRFEANQPQQNMSVAEQVVQEGIGAVQPTMMAEGGRTPFTAKYSNGGGIGFPQMAGRLRRNLRLNRFGLPEQIDPTTEAEFVDYNRGLDVGIGLPIFESYRQEDLGPVPPSMAESNRAALANLGDVISRDQTTRFDLSPEAYATGRRDTPIERGIQSLNFDFPENDPTQPSRRQRRMDDSPLGDFTESYVSAFGSDPNLRTGRSAGRPVQVSDVLNPLDGITFAATSDTPRGDDTAAGLTSAQILSNARNNIENARNLQNESSAELLAQIQPNQIDKTATDFEAPTVVDDPVKRAVQTLDDIGANTDTTVVTGPTVADAAKTDPVSIAAKQYADLLGGEKNDKMRNAMMLASLGAGIAKGDTAGGLQQAANVAASYQQKEIERAEKGLDRAIKRADTEAMQDLKRQEVEGRIGYYDVLKLNAQNEQTRLAQAANLKDAERDASLRQTATRTLNDALNRELQGIVDYKTMSDAEKAATRRRILNQAAETTLRFEGSLYTPFLDQLINSMAGATGGESRSSSYTVTEVR